MLKTLKQRCGDEDAAKLMKVYLEASDNLQSQQSILLTSL